MPQLLKHLFQQLPPFILLGISIALGIGIFMLFSYMLLWGLLIGAILWGINLVVQYFRSVSAPPPSKSSNKGRVIDHDQQ
ncbi:MAG: hypothetical protein K0U10_03360 [Gammaproteobacteria bacterium]|nr:hypothetical protein [Gammaproteobacteria bacterium]